MCVMLKKTGEKISIITPCYNSDELIEETIRSVVENSIFQDGQTSLQYIVCDGGSTDDTCITVERIFSSIHLENADLFLISEPDGGMYDALVKGLELATGDICAYINAGDYYSPNVFEIVLEIFQYKFINWLTGLQVSYNERSHLIRATLPFKFRKRLIKCGMYGRSLPFLQQESTFWRGALTENIDLNRLSKFKYAGDYFIWNEFSNTEQLYIVEAWLGGFKKHHNQLSENLDAYYKEMIQVKRNASLIDYVVMLFDWIIWHSPNGCKKYLNRDSLFTFDMASQRYLPHGDNKFL